MLRLPDDAPLAKSLLAAIHAGSVDALQRLLQDNPGASTALIQRPPHGPRPPLRTLSRHRQLVLHGCAVLRL